MGVIDEVKARIDIVDLVSETVKLRRAGRSFSGFCPFHANTRTAAFAVFPESGTWRCFGQCNEGGDIFKFVMKREGWDFPAALKYLAERAGVHLEPLTPERQEAAEEHERLRSLLEEAVTFYRHQLMHTPAGRSALDYLLKRQVNQPTIESFGLGYAPEGWDIATNYFASKGYSPQELLQVGLVSERESGGVYDRFRNRITFPIRDMLGKMTGFGARILNPEDMPKFLNSPQTVLFDKGALLYGLDQARRAIRAQDQVVIVEGYLDVIALHQGGFANTVSPMGTALTEAQLRLLKRFTRRIVLALDADAAGEKATLRGLELARSTLDHAEEIGFDARGLLRHEARLQADLRVTTLPPGKDPDEVVNQNPADWQKILDSAKPIVVHVMEAVAVGQDLGDPKVKGSIARQILPLIEDVPDPVERDAYRQRLARLLRVDERALNEAAPPAARPKPSRPTGRTAPRESPGAAASASKAAARPSLKNPLEIYCLAVLLRRPDALHLVDRALQQAGLQRLSPQDFEKTTHQILMRLLQQSLEQVELDPYHHIQAHLADILPEIPPEFTNLAYLEVPLEEKQTEELVRSVLRLRFEHVKEYMNQLRYMQEEIRQASASPEGDPRPPGEGGARTDPYSEMIQMYIQTRIRLDKALHQPLTRESKS